MFRRLFGGSKFLKKMNTLMEIYAVSKNRTDGEQAWYDLNRAALLYDMRKLNAAADVVREIPSLNPEFDARCAQLKTKIMDAF